ncbi:MAG: PepSY domain-containing protein [Allorhizobium sp.]
MFRQIHSAVGLVGALLVVMMALSGAILSLDPALERVGSTIPFTGSVALGDFAAKVFVNYPGAERIVRKPSGMVLVYYFDKDVPGIDIVDPLSAARIETYVQSPFTRWLTNLHRSFLMGDSGRAVAGICAAVMLVLSLSGVVLLVSRMGGWRRVFGRVRGTGSKRLHSEIGRVVILAFMLTAMTACYMSLTTFGYLSDGMDAEPAEPAAVNGGARLPVADIPAFSGIDLNALRELAFPYVDDPTDVYTLTTTDSVSIIDQATGNVVSFLPHNLTRRIYETIYMLHTGQGLWWLGLVLGAAALCVPVMAFSGVQVWWSRRSAMPRINNNARAAVADTIILVGSEGNSTWGFAATLKTALTEAGHVVHVAPMNAVATSYKSAKRMFILTSTYGDGTAPASARQFLARLEGIKTVPQYSVAVLGFGDRQFAEFCGYAREVESAIAARGWRQLIELRLIDRQSAQDFQRWGEDVGRKLGVALVLEHQAVLPPCVGMQLTERADYGAEFQSPAVVLRFAAAERAGAGIWQRLFGKRLPKFEAGDLVGIMAPNTTIPRYYSLASASTDGILEICVRRQPGGVCSEFLYGLQVGDAVTGFIRKNAEFRPLPGKVPVILIGAGTGIGPLAGFIRGNLKHRPMHLYFGVRDPKSDFLYEKELRGWVDDKRLTHLDMAFSRISTPAYVQGRVGADADAIRALLARGGQVMVCGGREMAKGVRKVMEEIVMPLGLDVSGLKKAGRYLEDVY